MKLLNNKTYHAHRWPLDFVETYVALGANLGNRVATLKKAIVLLDQHSEYKVVRCSRLYETEPVGYEEQPPFLNMVLLLYARAEPLHVLRSLLKIEEKLGRVRTIRNGPRTIDLDLLWMGGMRWNDQALCLPHPRMHERAFVLVPLLDILSKTEPSSLYKYAHSSLQLLDRKDGVTLWGNCNWAEEFELIEN